MNKLYRLLGAALATLVPAAAFAIWLNPITVPTPASDLQYILNAYIIAPINNELGNYINFQPAGLNPGELQLNSATSFAQNGTVATAMSSLGPVGSHTTVQKWLLVVDQSGNSFYAPLF